MTKKEFDALHLQNWHKDRDDELRDHIQRLNHSNDVLKTAMGRIAMGWHLVVVPEENVDAAVEWCKPQEIRVLKVDAYIYFTTEDLDGFQNGVVFIFEDKEKAALFKTFFG